MIFNDEPSYKDELGYYTLVRRIGHRVLKCDPPYVIGVCGSWGSGKTSFLRQLWAYLDGEFENEGDFTKLAYHQRSKWFGETWEEFNKQVGKRNLELVWFNPWQHQFESSPLVALLGEIRRQFSFRHKLFDKAGKLTDVAIHSTLNALAEMGKELKIHLPSTKSVMERGREYEAERFSTMLSSQRFREFFEGAIKEITREKKGGKKGLLVIFIDDLDRCEGDMAYRLLEALKLYLNASNCVYVLGLDQQHLESSIARALSGEKETWRYRPLARDYLSKMFQGLFLLPVPRHAANYVNKVLHPEDGDFKQKLEAIFDFKDGDWAEVERALDENLPHNPRKIKSFIASWKLYLDLLPDQPAGETLDWRLTLILHYLAQFEEPLFRKVEEAPAFYNDHIVRFCFNGQSNNWMFDGLERPYEMTDAGASSAPPPLDPDTGGTETTVAPGAPIIGDAANKDDSRAASPHRVFWISRLIIQLANDKSVALDPKVILRHLPYTGDAAK
ncbi:MAG: KAP family P-loop NTPase fold protein [Blastocatellia bacterium]